MYNILVSSLNLLISFQVQFIQLNNLVPGQTLHHGNIFIFKFKRFKVNLK